MSLAFRSEKLAEVRQFFAERGVMEVDTPVLQPAAPVDLHIEVMEVEMGHGKRGYLHTSPEYAMKKLLCQGCGDIYQLGHVFRAEEEGPIHLSEFTMIEWYRLRMPFAEMIAETVELVALFVGNREVEVWTYDEAFSKIGGLSLEGAVDAVKVEGEDWSEDDRLGVAFSEFVEPSLGRGVISVVTDFPASQAALAKTHVVNGKKVAKRFEIYVDGLELANGYDELGDGEELLRRFEEANQERGARGKKELPIDYELIEALRGGFPECCGVAAGFDRLLMLNSSQSSLVQWGNVVRR